MTKQKAKFAEAIEASNKRIANAMEVLKSTNRGVEVLLTKRRIREVGGGGLDSVGMRAMVTLVKEFAAGRRDFLDKV